jgi:hypothetical protein
MRFAFFMAFSFFTFGSLVGADDAPLSTAEAEKLFVGKVLPLLKSRCFACHGDSPDGELKGDLDLTSRKAILKGGESEEPSFVPGKPKESLIYQAIRWDGYEMPPKENDRLNETEIAYFKKWISAGAPWPDEKRLSQLQQESWEAQDGVIVTTSGGQSEDWTNRKYAEEDLWAFQPLNHPEVPPSSSGNSSSSNIDAIINQKQKEAGIQPAGKADKLTLIRRATYDLTGLPPTPQEVNEFLNDQSPQAFHKLIDRLLDSPGYGEQMARHWLDVVRYADTAGFSNDFERPNAWRYRDYVIRAFNTDKPYDIFVTEQLAGDEILTLRKPSTSRKSDDVEQFVKSTQYDLTQHKNTSDSELQIAPGFLRMGPWEHTGMSVMAITRQQFLDDVVNSTGETFLATALRCCKCHDHKFDPMPTLDYYRMQAVFAPVQFAERKASFDQWERTDGYEGMRQRIVGLNKNPGISLHIHDDATEQELDDASKGVAKVVKKQKSIRERQQYRYDPLAFSVYNGPLNMGYRSNNSLHPMPGKMKGDLQQVHILKGGSIETPTDMVTPGVLSALPNSNDLVSSNEWNTIPQSLHGRRLALAQWIASTQNPLTSRVMVNRIWQWHFGKGLAQNPNNFGSTGKKPSHPELLDYLASQFMSQGWSIKKLHRHIMLSETYQRAGTPPNLEQAASADPTNKLLSWFPPRRLSGEEIRDSMLSISGELNREMGGVPIRPEINREVAFQPRHVMGSVAPAYQPSPSPEERNRRTIYAYKVRTLRDPMLEVFDQPNADNSCERRTESTVTPQVFSLFNSQNSYSRALAMATDLTETTDGESEQIQQAFRRAYGRVPSEIELQTCVKHLEKMTAHHLKNDPVAVSSPLFIIREMVEEMTGVAFQWREELDLYQNYIMDLQMVDASPETRAFADLCLILMNSNEFLYVY